MMVAEIIGGWMFNSMSLLADGWHMSSHAWLLKDEHGRDHHNHETHAHHHHDLNQRSVYLHVVADAATSVLAILVPTGGKVWGAS